LSEKIGNLGGKIDILTEVVTTGFSELKAITREQAETAKQQAETAKQQVESISRLAATVERQVQIVERRLLPNGLAQ
jgi:methyl-accepting chemotaxis protein